MNQNVDRRSLVATTGGAVVAAMAAQPAAAAALAEREAPLERVHRLSRELARAMDDWSLDLSGDVWMAEIYPASSREYPIGYCNVSARDDARWGISDGLRNAIAANETARSELNDACPGIDEVVQRQLGKKVTRAATRRWTRLNAAIGLSSFGRSVGGEAVCLFQFANLAIWSTPITAMPRLRMQSLVSILAGSRLQRVPAYDRLISRKTAYCRFAGRVTTR